MRERIERLEAARRVPGAANRYFTDVGKDGYGDDAAWIAALEDNRIRWVGGPPELQSVRYEDLRKIDFSGPESAHSHWREQLSRFYWMRPLALKYLETREKKYARMARDTIEAWLDFHKELPYLTCTKIRHYDTTLTISLRMGQCRCQGWWGSVPYFEESGLFDEAFIGRMREDAADKLEYVRRNHAKNGNWRMSELNAIFFCGYVLGLDEYVAYAVRQLNEAFRNQFEPDGSHCEHTPGYHEWMLGLFRDFAVLGKNMPELGIDTDCGKLLKGCQYCLHAYAPDGRITGINDSLRWNPLGAVRDLEAMAEEYRSLVDYFGMDAKAYALTPSGWFFNAGQFFLRSNDTMFIFDATNDGGWHTHTGRNAVNLYHGGRMILTDPGCIDYEMFNPFTVWGRSTFLHNTVTLSGMSQPNEADAHVRFHCESEKVAMINSVYSGGYFNEASNRIGRHTRTFLWVKGKFALVIDGIDAGLYGYFGHHRKNSGALLAYESHWQFGEERVIFDDTALSAFTKGSKAERLEGSKEGIGGTGESLSAFEPLSLSASSGNVLIKALYSSDPLTARLYCGSMSPVRGFVAKAGTSGIAGEQAAPMLSFEGVGNCHSRIAQLIVPFEGDTPPTVTAHGELIDGTLHLTFILDGETWRFAINVNVLDGNSSPSMVGEMADLKSDAMMALAGNRFAWLYNGKRLALGNAVLIVSESHVPRNGLHLFLRVPHGHREPCRLKHRNIIWAVAARHHVLILNPQPCADHIDGVSLAGRRPAYLQVVVE
ncbi:MAG: heparinase II/III family protein [Kiritimatiellaeota bacterium]|nr:heparinase II/III family protein [Kiritimatiellota bacterium]